MEIVKYSISEVRFYPAFNPVSPTAASRFTGGKSPDLIKTQNTSRDPAGKWKSAGVVGSKAPSTQARAFWVLLSGARCPSTYPHFAVVVPFYYHFHDRKSLYRTADSDSGVLLFFNAGCFGGFI